LGSLEGWREFLLLGKTRIRKKRGDCQRNNIRNQENEPSIAIEHFQGVGYEFEDTREELDG